MYDIITTRSLLCYDSITIKANLYVFGISRLTKNHQYKIRLRRRLAQTLVFPKFSCMYSIQYMVPKLFQKYYYEKCNYSTFPMPKTITQIRPDDRIKGKRKAQRQRQ